MLKTGIVLETKKKSVHIMSSEFEFYKLKNKAKGNPKVGEVYTGETFKKRKFSFKLLISLFLLSLIVAFAIFIFNKASVRYSAIIDVNTSIELKLNKSNKVVSAVPLNEEALNVTQGLDLKHKSLNTAILLIIERAEKLHFINQDYYDKKKVVSIYISSHDNIKIDFSSLEKSAPPYNVNIAINDYGEQHKIMSK